MKKRKLSPLETGFHIFFLICGILSVAFVLFISIYLIISGLPAIREGRPDQVSVRSEVGAAGNGAHFGILSFILTSIYGTAGASGHRCAAGHYDRRVPRQGRAPKAGRGDPHRLWSCWLASRRVVYGLVGMIVLVPAIRKAFKLSSGACLLAAILVLAVMILPSIINVSETALQAVPREYEEASPGAGRHRDGDLFPGHPSTPPAAAWPPQWCWAWAAPSARPWPSSWWPATWPICPDCSQSVALPHHRHRLRDVLCRLWSLQRQALFSIGLVLFPVHHAHQRLPERLRQTQEGGLNYEEHKLVAFGRTAV